MILSLQGCMAVGKTTAVRYLQENALRMKYLLPLKRKWFIGKENVDVLNVDNLNADEVSKLIIKTLRTTNIKDYSAEYIENDVKMFTPDGVIERAGWMHFYVISDKEAIVACGAIGPYWGKEDESILPNDFISLAGKVK